MMGTRRAKLIKKTVLSADTTDFCFALEEGQFTGLEPGAHVDIRLSDDLVRQYSIWNWDQNGKWLNVAVKREDAGRGGSLAMHALNEGQSVQIGMPRNHFVLQDGPNHKTLIAGGIGATPIFAMARQLQNSGADFRVIYLVRSKELAALDDAFSSLNLGDRYQLHCDETSGPIELKEVMQSVPLNGDIYTCGPEPLLNAILEAGKSLRGGTIHFERFAASSDVDHGENAAFEVEIESTQAVYHVGPDDSILNVLKQNGIHVDVGCAEGLCGSCMVDVVSGDVDHRDGLLTPEEQASNEVMCLCVSRAKSDRLTLRL